MVRETDPWHLRGLVARRTELEARAVLENEARRRREAHEAAGRVSDLRSRLLLELTDEQLDGHAPLTPDIAEAWSRVFPDRPVIDGHLATGAQMQRLAEMREREGLVDWLVSTGRTVEEARAAVAAEYGDPGPSPTSPPRPAAAPGRGNIAEATGEDWDRYSKAAERSRAEVLGAFGLRAVPPAPAAPKAAETAGSPRSARMAGGWWMPGTPGGSAAGHLQLRESASTLDPATVSAAGGAPVPVVILTPGWGSSGHYSPQVLEQAARDRVIPAGTQMFMDHPTESQRRDRPERSVRDLVGVLTEDARWDGRELVSKAQFFPPYDARFRAMSGAIGLSITGSATDIQNGTAEGRSGPIVAGLARVDSVDVVTRAGRGGRIVA